MKRINPSGTGHLHESPAVSNSLPSLRACPLLRTATVLQPFLDTKRTHAPDGVIEGRILRWAGRMRQSRCAQERHVAEVTA